MSGNGYADPTRAGPSYLLGYFHGWSDVKAERQYGEDRGGYQLAAEAAASRADEAIALLHTLAEKDSRYDAHAARCESSPCAHCHQFAEEMNDAMSNAREFLRRVVYLLPRHEDER